MNRFLNFWPSHCDMATPERKILDRSHLKRALNALTLAAFFGLMPLDNQALAQDLRAFQKSIFPSQSSRAASGSTTKGKFDLSSALTIEDAVSTQYQENGALTDSIVRTERQLGALTFVRNTFDQRHIDNVVSARAMDALDLSDSATHQIAAYEGTLLISRLLSASPIANFYSEFTQNLRTVRNYLLFRVSPGRDGSLSVEPKKEYGHNETFFELRVTPSTRDGIQPRLRLGENVSLSYDFRESTPFLEYNINF